MENCLVTKLKGAVQNDNLPILGAVTVLANKWNSSSEIRLTIEVTEVCKVIVPVGETILTATVDNNTSDVNSREYTLAANTETKLAFSYNGAATYPITIANGSAIKTLKPVTQNTNITINPDTVEYQYLTNIVTFGYTNFMSHTTYGSKSHLLDLFWSKKMTNIYMNSHGFSGSIESIAEQLWNIGKRSGTIYATALIKNTITFNGAASTAIGSAANDVRFYFSASNVRITVDGGPTLATYDGISWTYA